MPSNIEMNRDRVSRATRRVPLAACPPVLVFLVSTIPLTGCQLKVDPFKDELAGRQEITTASVEGARTAQTAPAMPRARGYAPFELHAEPEGVTHGPLYFEDPFEDKGSEDGQFAWTGEDYLQLFYWRARYLLNGIFLPVSLVVTPPWTVMESDGHLSRQALGYDHDAERAVAPSSDEPTGEVSTGG